MDDIGHLRRLRHSKHLSPQTLFVYSGSSLFIIPVSSNVFGLALLPPDLSPVTAYIGAYIYIYTSGVLASEDMHAEANKHLVRELRH